MRTWPFLVAAFLNDAALYLAFAALPFRALELGAGPVALGALPTLYAGAYMLSASRGGRVSDRVPRLVLARRACLVFAAGALVLGFAPTLPLLFLALPVLGLALGFYWSPLQAALADRTDPVRLPRALGTFNVAWSLGKGSGIVLGGLITDLLDPGLVLWLAALPALVTVFVLPRGVGRADEGNGPAPAPRDPGAPAPTETFVRLAWMSNALAYGVVGTVNMHAPELLLAGGAGPSAFGLLFGAVFLVQTVTFAVHTRHRPGPAALLGALALATAGLGLFLAAPSFGVRLLAAVPIGIATGLAYQASLHASLDRAHGRGRAAGLHETLLGAGSSTVPLAGGAAAALTGRLLAPFVLALAVSGAALISAAALRGGRPRAVGVSRG
jgi:predicted MFS family arabinose efflux permease